MAEDQQESLRKVHHTSGGDPYLLHGTLTEAEQKRIDDDRRIREQEEKAQATREAQAAYNERQLELMASNNRITASNVALTRSLACFTLLGVLVGVFQGYISKQSADTARAAVDVSSQTLIETQRSNAEQATAASRASADARGQAKEAATLAKNSLQASVDNFHREQRAWIGFDATVPGDFSAGAGFPVEMDFVNTGRSPARHVSLSPAFCVTDSPILLTAIPRSGLNRIAVSRISKPDIPPDGRVRHLLGDDPAHNIGSRFETIKGRVQLIYYFGLINYEDIFGQPHKTKYCVYLSDPMTKQFIACNFFNEMD